MRLLKELCEAPGISGREQKVIDIMTRELKKSATRVSIDNMGNVIGYRKGMDKNPLKIMLAAHMDEIGFIVSHIDNNGFVRFAPRGGHVPRVLISQRVKIHGKKTIIGVVEAAPFFLASPESRTKVPELKDLYIDTGYNEKKLRKIIEVGDIIVLDRKFIRQGNICIAKAFDNRVACYVILETMKQLPETAAEVYAVGTSQEEVGLRGAFSAARAVNPDFGIAVDVTGAFDTPGVADHQQVSRLGEGVAIKISDSASISNHGVVQFLKELAVAHKIPYQMEILPFGGTDAAAMQRYGRGPVCTLSIPTRYVHSPNEMLHRRDVEAAIDLLVKFITNIKDCKLEF
ncbi:MAG: M42 family metallopeptidase [Candidatus Cloacimonetes bacterium]|nr:M42 family metallopeptidase [Candidatus Cloacimonadota bacterium]